MPQALVFVGQMKDEAERLRRLVLDLLDLSRLDSVPTPGTITDVRAAATNALAAHRAAASDAGLTLALDLSAVAESDVYAAAEPTDVAVALDNLLANAIAYTAHGGVTVRLAADEHDVTVSVTDTGIGIPAEHLPRVFERFYRVDAARTRVSGGTGLGLSLVRNAAERAGGTVSIDSSVGQGTTVTLRLPRTV
jgi:signal transduction histidine kinase